MLAEYEALLDRETAAEKSLLRRNSRSFRRASFRSLFFFKSEESLLEKADLYTHSIEEGKQIDPNKLVNVLEAVMHSHITRMRSQEAEWRQHFLHLTNAAIVIILKHDVVGTPRATERLRKFRVQVCGKQEDADMPYEIATLRYETEHKALRAILSKENADSHLGQWQSFYYGSIRVRNVYLVSTTALLVVALFSGFIIQFFFLLFDHGISAPSKVLGLLVLPVGMVFFAALGDELYDLAVDTFDYPTMPMSRATKLAAMHYLFTADLVDHDPETLKRWICRFIDWWGTYFMDLCCILPAAIMYLTCGTSITDAAVCGGMVWAFLTLLFFIVCDVAINVVHLKYPKGVTTPMRAVDMFNDAFSAKNINQGQMSMEYHVIKAHCRTTVRLENEVENERRRKNRLAAVGDLDDAEAQEAIEVAELEVEEYEGIEMAEPQGALAKRYFLLGYIVIWAPFSVIFTLFLDKSDWAFPLVAFVMTVCIFCLSKSLTLSMPDIVGNPYFGFLFLIGGLTFSLFVSGYSASSSAAATSSHTEPLMTINYDNIGEASADGGLPIGWFNNETTRYPVCLMEWGAQTRKLQVHDLSALAMYVYAEDEDDFVQVVETSFAGARGLGNNISVLKITPYNVLPRWAAIRFAGETADDEDTIVVAVKGTSTTADAYTDTSLYSMISVLQMFNHLTPLLSTIPPAVTSWFLAKLRLPVTQQAEKTIFLGFADIILQLQREHPNAKFVMTGHSLGGGISEAVGSRLGLPTIVFSAPGMSFSKRRFKSTWMRTVRNVIGVVPETDAVPAVDEHMDMVQNIACRRPDGTHRWFYECHSIKVTACELWRACGDMRRRDFTAACAPLVGNDTLAGYFEV